MSAIVLSRLHLGLSERLGQTEIRPVSPPSSEDHVRVLTRPKDAARQEHRKLLRQRITIELGTGMKERVRRPRA